MSKEEEPLIDSLAEIIVRDEEVPVLVVEVVGRVLLAEKFKNVEWLREASGGLGEV